MVQLGPRLKQTVWSSKLAERISGDIVTTGGNF
jgi:hypothetical protein